MHMNHIKLGAAMLQLQKEIEKKVCLCKETCVSRAFPRLSVKVSRVHIIRNSDGFDSDTRHERFVASKERHSVPALH